MQLFIAEKPSLGRAIASAFSSKEERDGYISINNDEIIVSWCFGHILEKTDFKKKARKIKIPVFFRLLRRLKTGIEKEFSLC